MKKIVYAIIALLIVLLVLVKTGTIENNISNTNYSECLKQTPIPSEFGVPQYSVDEIKAMKDYSLEEVKESISTIADLAQYYYETGFVNNESPGDYKLLLDNNYILSVHASPQAVFDKKLTCCGCISTLSNYILEGDYDEEGYILTADCSNNVPHGGHVYNYFSRNGKILTVDFLGTKVGKLDRLYLVNSLEELNDYNYEGEDYLYIKIAIKDYCGNVPALYFGIDNGHGSTLTYFFDTYYKDHIIKINYDIEQMKKFDVPFELTNYIEDKGFDPSIIPQDKVDNNIDNWDNRPKLN